MYIKRECIPVLEDERKLARECASFDEFSSKYIMAFGTRVSLHALPKRVSNVWDTHHNPPIRKAAPPRDNFPDMAHILIDILTEIRLLRVQIDEFSGLKNCGVALADVHDIMKKVAAKQREIDVMKRSDK